MSRTIGIFDSGVGGLTVVRAVRAALPNAAIVYLGDTARVPYGSKSPRTVERYSLACLNFLLRHDVALVLIACNTASANALGALEAASPVTVIGAVQPGAETAVASSSSGHIGVIGTLSTVASKAYDTAIKCLAPSAVVTALACPLLVPLAEEGWADDDVAEAIARRYLTALFDSDPAIDTLVLGCTHYPLLAATLGRVANELATGDVAIVDSATAMAARAKLALPLSESESESDVDEGATAMHFYVTDATRLDVLGPRFLGVPLGGFDLVDL